MHRSFQLSAQRWRAMVWSFKQNESWRERKKSSNRTPQSSAAPGSGSGSRVSHNRRLSRSAPLQNPRTQTLPWLTPPPSGGADAVNQYQKVRSGKTKFFFSNGFQMFGLIFGNSTATGRKWSLMKRVNVYLLYISRRNATGVGGRVRPLKATVVHVYEIKTKESCLTVWGNN